MKVLVKRRQRVRLRCANPSCRHAIVMEEGKFLRVAGNHRLGKTGDGAILLLGECPSCSQKYSVSDLSTYFPAWENSSS